jgi:LmbE family N-acetylglucosaminyl deacetylase
VSATPVTSPPAVFYAPHADDETLSMGVDVGNHLLAGRSVVLVLMTQGCSPGLLGILGGTTRCGWHGGDHAPDAEAYADGERLDVAAVGRARVAEFTSAAGAYRLLAGGALQVRVEGLPDGGVSVEAATAVITAMEAAHPGASHKTMTPQDTEPDHAACGLALQQLRNAGVVSDARWYVRTAQVPSVTGVTCRRVRPATDAVAAAVRRAATCYQAWNPAGGSYAVGYHSVRASFDALVADPFATVHA